MVMERKSGIMGQLNMLANFIKEKRMEKESLNGKMVVIMKEILLMVNSLVLVLISLLILIKHIQVNLEIVIWKEKGKKCGQMEEDMKEILKMVKKMEKGCLNGPMGQDILDLGEMGSNMD